MNFQPLADRLRPEKLEEFFGQDNLLGQNQVLRRLIETGNIPSMIFWGPPGCGKTSLAKIISARVKAKFIFYQAVDFKIPEVRKILETSQLEKRAYQTQTIFCLDEIHRLNKAQQAIFLPFVEEGSIILIATTTENPSFEIISPLLSRCRLFCFQSLSEIDLQNIIKRALADQQKGFGKLKIDLEPKASQTIINLSAGDSRVALNILETALLSAQSDKNLVYHLNEKDILATRQKKQALYGRGTDERYNLISAFIKSMRGSDPNASLYWMARMLEGGEDPLFIARRMVIFASEDIGNADSRALEIALNVFRAVEIIGLPEARINLAAGVTYLATAPKSNLSYLALLAAEKDASQTLDLEVPLHLRNAPTKLMRDLDYGKGYLYPHDYEQKENLQDYLPPELKGRKYYKGGLAEKK